MTIIRIYFHITKLYFDQNRSEHPFGSCTLPFGCSEDSKLLENWVLQTSRWKYATFKRIFRLVTIFKSFCINNFLAFIINKENYFRLCEQHTESLNESDVNGVELDLIDETDPSNKLQLCMKMKEELRQKLITKLKRKTVKHNMMSALMGKKTGDKEFDLLL